jgi:hypothetical protein
MTVTIVTKRYLSRLVTTSLVPLPPLPLPMGGNVGNADRNLGIKQNRCIQP